MNKSKLQIIVLNLTDQLMGLSFRLITQIKTDKILYTRLLKSEEYINELRKELEMEQI